MGMILRCSWLLPLLFLDGASSQECIPRTLDFVILDGDATNRAIEDDIREELAPLGITLVPRFLPRAEFNAAMTSGDFNLCFSETWGAPYDPVSTMVGWTANNEAHYSAMSGCEGPTSRENIFSELNQVLAETNPASRETRWSAIHNLVHQSAVNLPMWGKRIPAILNTRLSGYQPGQQQFDYPVHTISVQSGISTVTIAPGAQTGLFQTVSRLDPHSYRPNEFFANNWVYEGLVSYGPQGQILPALATSWTESANGATFTLRQGVTFTDGAAWNCAAAKLNFDHVMAEPMRTADWHGWYELPFVYTGCSCDANDRLVITTSRTSSALLQELSFIRPIRMLSPNSFMSQAADSWMTHNSCPTGWGNITLGSVTISCAGISAPVGTGPFKFMSRTQSGPTDALVDDEVVFERNTNWWGGSVGITTLVVKRYVDSAAVKSALETGALDMVIGDGVLPPADINTFMTASNFNVVWTDVLMHVIIIINSGKHPTDDIHVREAIIHGVDKATIIEREMGGLWDAVDRLFPRETPHSDVDLTPRWDYDAEKARMLQCPVTASSSSSSNNDKAVELGLGLGLGLGVPLFLAIIAAVVFYMRSMSAEKELKKALTNNADTPSTLGSAEAI